MPRPAVARGLIPVVFRATPQTVGLIACVAIAATWAAFWLMRAPEEERSDRGGGSASALRSARPGPVDRPASLPAGPSVFEPTPLLPAQIPELSDPTPLLTSAPFNPAGSGKLLASGVVIDQQHRPVPHARIVGRRLQAATDPASVGLNGVVELHPDALSRAVRLSVGLRLTGLDNRPEEPFAEWPSDISALENIDSTVVAEAGSDGRFALFADAAEDETYLVRVESDCCRTESPLLVTPGTTDAVVKVRCFAVLTARVEIGGRRLGPEDVRVRVVDAECVGRTAFDVGSGRSGFFQAVGLADGPAIIEVYAHGGAEPVARIETVQLAAGRRAEDVRLDPIDLDPFARSVSVRVTDAAGRPVPGASVRKTTDRLSEFGSEPSCRSRMSSAGSVGAGGGVVADRDGTARVIIRRQGEDIAVSCSGFVSERLGSVRDDRSVRLARYRTIDVQWTEPPSFEPAAAEASEASPWWDVLLTFEPSDGGAGWTTVYSNVEPRRLYCEQQGTFRCEFRVHAGAAGLPFDFVERPAWTASFDVTDQEEPQVVRIAPPAAAEIAAVMPRLVDRVRYAKEAAAHRAETTAVR